MKKQFVTVADFAAKMDDKESSEVVEGKYEDIKVKLLSL